MIGRILMVAGRDVRATVLNKGFLLGILLTPALVLLMTTLVPRLMSAARNPQVRGEIALIDRSGQLLPALRAALEPAAITALRDQFLRESLQGGGAPPPPGQPPVLRVDARPADAQTGTEKSWLIEPAGAPPRHLALVVIPQTAVTLAPGQADYGPYELYVSKGLNEATETVVRGAVREALVSARLKIQGIGRTDVDRAMRVVRPDAVVVVAAGEQHTQRVLQRLLPFICGVLLLLAVITGGQALMTSTIEEKSNRVIEVLLAAVSPLELMWGKLLAQLATGLVVLGVYVGLGLSGLAQSGGLGAVSPALVADLVVLFVLAYLTYGALMLTVGAAVSSVADAQSLLTPVMLLLILPYMLTIFIGQAPNSTLSVVLSFVPPVNTFVMLARLASESPPPFWQVPVTFLVGLVFAGGVLWFAAKVFRIGLLLHGKPPSVGTLLRWARMA